MISTRFYVWLCAMNIIYNDIHGKDHTESKNMCILSLCWVPFLTQTWFWSTLMASDHVGVRAKPPTPARPPLPFTSRFIFASRLSLGAPRREARLAVRKKKKKPRCGVWLILITKSDCESLARGIKMPRLASAHLFGALPPLTSSWNHTWHSEVIKFVFR